MGEGPAGETPPAQAGPRLRERPEDFFVEEISLYPASGSGEHTFLWIEKCLRTTEEVARELARRAGVKARDVGYAGRKDRRALTRQWFSVPRVDPAEAASWPLEGASVLEAIRHPHKLRVGQLRGNRFDLLVAGVAADALSEARARLDAILRTGMRNAYGAQRYGRYGDNSAEARAVLRGEGRRRDRRHERFLLSALQSEIFDAVLAAHPGPLDAVEVGDVAQVIASGGLFVVEDLLRESPRAKAFEISATGPMIGERAVVPSGEPADREEAVLEHFGAAELLPALARHRVRGTRRALRAKIEDASLEAEERGVRLRFTLPRGSYATVLVEEVFAKAAGPRRES